MFYWLVRSFEKNLFLPKDAISLCKNLQSGSFYMFLSHSTYGWITHELSWKQKDLSPWLSIQWKNANKLKSAFKHREKRSWKHFIWRKDITSYAWHQCNTGKVATKLKSFKLLDYVAIDIQVNIRPRSFDF